MNQEEKDIQHIKIYLMIGFGSFFGALVLRIISLLKEIAIKCPK